MREPNHRIVVVGPNAALSEAAAVFDDWAEALDLPDWELVTVPLATDAGRDAVQAALAGARATSVRGVVVRGGSRLSVFEYGGPLVRAADDAVRRFGAVSCLLPTDGGWDGYALDPVATVRVLDRVAGVQYWSSVTSADAVVLGAGSTGRILALSLLQLSPGPRRVLVTDVAQSRLDALIELARERGVSERLVTRRVTGAAGNDDVLDLAAEASLVVNATGIGHESYGSPVTEAAQLPLRGIVWELNHEGPLEFLESVNRQADDLLLRVHDGWDLSLETWAEALSRITGRVITSAQLADATN